MKDAATRAIRTFIQGFIGVLVLIAVPILNNLVQTVAGGGTIEIDANVWQSIGIAAVAGGVIAIISFAHNELESASGTSIGPK